MEKEGRREERRLGERGDVAAFGGLHHKVVSRERAADSFGEERDAAQMRGEEQRFRVLSKKNFIPWPQNIIHTKIVMSLDMDLIS